MSEKEDNDLRNLKRTLYTEDTNFSHLVLEVITTLESEIERLKKENLRILNEKEDNWQLYVDANKQTLLKEARIRKYIEEIERLKSSSEGVKTGLAISLCEHGKEWTREYYKCEHDGIMYSRRDPQKALIVAPELKEWLTNVMSHLEENYNDNTYEIVEIKGLAVEEKKEDVCICKNCITENMHTCYNCGKTL